MNLNQSFLLGQGISTLVCALHAPPRHFAMQVDQKVSLDALCCDSFACVLSFGSVSDIVRCRAVCKQFRAFVDHCKKGIVMSMLNRKGSIEVAASCIREVLRTYISDKDMVKFSMQSLIDGLPKWVADESSKSKELIARESAINDRVGSEMVSTVISVWRHMMSDAEVSSMCCHFMRNMCRSAKTRNMFWYAGGGVLVLDTMAEHLGELALQVSAETTVF